jgi:hypothetical protein
MNRAGFPGGRLVWVKRPSLGPRPGHNSVPPPRREGCGRSCVDAPCLASLILVFWRGFDRTCVRPHDVAFDHATGRYAVRKAGFTSVQRAASARAPGLNVPALNFEVRIAYSSSITHPGLAAMPCLRPIQARVTPSGNRPASSSRPRSSAPSCSPARPPQPSSVCA